MRSLSLLALTATLILAQPKGEPEAKKTRLEGRVLSITGAPVPRATILLRYSIPASPEQLRYRPTFTADDEGKYFAEDMPPGTYVLQAQKPGFVTQYAGAKTAGGSSFPYTVAAGQTLTGVDFRMTPQSVISGTITSPEGDPLPGITVSLHGDGYVSGVRQLTPRGTARTDDRGVYRIPSVAPGRYFLSAGAGIFTAFTDKPVEKNAPKEILVTTYYPRATTPATAAKIDVPVGTDLSGINVTMLREKTYTIRATAVDASGNPVPNAALIVNDKTGVFGSALADQVSPPRSADGHFEFPGYIPGEYTVLAPAPSTLPDRNGFPPAPLLKGRTEVTIGKEDVDIQVRLYPGVELTATVRPEQGAEDLLKQAASARFFATEYEIPGFNNRSVNRDPDGVFRMKDVALSTYAIGLTPLPKGLYIKSVRFGGQDVTRQPLVLNGGGSLDILVSAKAADVSGTLRTEKGEVLVGSYVALWPVNPERSTITGGTRDAKTDTQGTFRFDNLPPGDYYLAAWDDVDEGRLGSADFRALFVSDAVKIKLDENSHLTQDPKPITVDRTTTQLTKLP